jgi:hypothetical protein
VASILVAFALADARAAQGQTPPVPSAEPYAWPLFVAPRPTEARSKNLIAGAGVLWGIGITLTQMGAAVVISDLKDGCSYSSPPHVNLLTSARACAGNEDYRLATAGIIVGQVLSYVGIPLFVIGMQRVPARPRRLPAPKMRLGLGGGDVVWTF